MEGPGQSASSQAARYAMPEAESMVINDAGTRSTVYPPLPSAHSESRLSLDKADWAVDTVNGELQNRLDAEVNRRKMVIIITAGSIGVITCMFGHHLFLSAIDSRAAGTSSQFWIKNASNALSQIVVLFMTFVAVSVLNQVVWHKVSLYPTQIKVIDQLFSLPSPIAILTLISKYGYTRILPLVQLAVLIQAFVIVSILAPNAIDIQPTRWRTVDTTISRLEFSAVDEVPYTKGHMMYSFVNPVENDRWDSWSSPRDCGSDCSINVQYQAPALSCRNLQKDELTVHPYSGGDWTIYSYNDSPISDQWGSPYPGFSFNYVPSISAAPDKRTLTVQQTGDIRGVECNFLEGMYTANLSMISGIKHASIVSTSTINGSFDGCSWDNELSLSPSCNLYRMSAVEFASVFSSLFDTSIRWTNTSETPTCQFTIAVALPQLFNITVTRHPVVGSPNQTYGLVSLDMNSTDLSRDIMNLFEGVILTAMLRTNETEAGPALILDHKATWAYEPRILWLTYGISIVLFLIFVGYGLYCGLIHGVSMISRFSTILLRTRRKELNDVCNLPPKARMQEYLLLDTTCDQFVCYKRPRSVPDPLYTPNAPTNSIEQKLNEDFTHVQPRKLVQKQRATLTILGAFAAAVALSVIHYVFLSKINGHNIERYSKFWMRNISNGLAQAVVLCLGVVATSSLTQATWREVRIRSVRIATIDRLFALPNPEAIFSLVGGFKARWELIPTFIAVMTYMAAIVSILAPNALMIGPSNRHPVQFTIPKLDYSKFDGGPVTPTRPQMEATNLPPELLWDIPSNCGAACAFEFEYAAPALSCVEVDIGMNEMIIDEEIFFLRGDWARDFSPDQWGPSSTYNFSTSYMEGVARVTNGSTPVFNLTTQPRQTICQCHDGLYKANFEFSDGQRSKSLRLLSHKNSFTESCPWGDMSSADTACQQYATASTSICDIYGNRTMGAYIKFYESNNRWLTVVNVRSSGAALWRLFRQRATEATEDRNFSLSLKGPILSEAHVQLFSDYTLGLIPDTNQTTVVNGTTWGENVWKFDQRTLWSVYAVSHTGMLLIALYGLYCIRDSNVTVGNTFSNVMLATRTEALDNACVAMPNHKAFLRLKLRHDEEGHFVIDKNSSRYQRDEERPDETILLATHHNSVVAPAGKYMGGT